MATEQETTSKQQLILVTRPKEDSASVMEILKQRGYESLTSPLLHIEYTDPTEEFSDWLAQSQAILFTSANGVRALEKQQKHRNSFLRLPVFAVGDATAREAKALGFTKVEVAAGDVDKLADLVKEKLKLENGPLLHIASSKLAGDLAGMLTQAGFVTNRAILYNSVKASQLSLDVVEALAHGRIRAVLLYSPRTSESFSTLVQNSNLGETLKNITAVCLSQNVADKLEKPLWGNILVAETPAQNDLLKKLDSVMQNETNSENTSIFSTHTAEEIIEAFGGIRPTATALNIAVCTVQGWKTRNNIPESHQSEILDALKKAEISLPEKMADANADDKEQDNKDEAPVTNKETNTEAKTVVNNEEKKQQADQNQDTDVNSVEENITNDTVTPPAPVVVKKRVSTFSIIGLPVLAAAMILQPYWSPAVTKAIEPIVGKFAPNLAAIKQAETEVARSDLTQLSNKLNNNSSDLQKQLDKLSADITSIGEKQTSESADSSGALTYLNEEIQNLKQTIADIDSKLAAQPVTVEGENGTVIDLSPMQTEIAAIKTRLGNLEEASFKMVGEVEKHINLIRQELVNHRKALESQIKQNAPHEINTRAVAVLVAVMELSNDLNKGRDLTPRLQQLQKVAGDNSNIQWELDNLLSLASDHIPTFNELLKEFAIVAANPEALKTDANSTQWLDATLNNLQNLVSIRRVGDDENAPPISRAEAALNRGDLTGAIRALAPLKADRKDVQDWLFLANKLERAEIGLGKIRQMASNTVLTIGGAEQVTGEAAQ